MGTPSGSSIGEFSVGPDGSANYVVPIYCPPSPGGLDPKLSLSYSSHGSNGVVGYGWSLNGIPMITRAPATLEQDGFQDPIDFDDNDRFAIGGERLILTSGEYGADGATYTSEQTTFSRVTSYDTLNGDPDYFVLETKSGITYEFGKYNGYFTSSKCAVNIDGVDKTMYWLCTKVKDPNGNIMLFEYEGPIGQDYNPKSIRYGLREGETLGVGYAVRFEYENRPDYVDRPYLNEPITGNGDCSYAICNTERLKKISSCHSFSYFGVREYNLNYTVSNYISYLSSIQECASDEDNNTECMDLLTFNWSGLNPLSFEEETCNCTYLRTEKIDRTSFGDFTGDGQLDIMTHKGTGYGDIDFYYQKEIPVTANVDFDFSLTNESFAGYSVYDSYTDSIWPSNAYVVDLNSDGYTDILFYNRINAKTHLYLSDRNGGFTEHPDYLAFFSSTYLPWWSHLARLYFGDWNGDAEPDILWHNWLTGENRWFLSDGEGSIVPSFSYAVNIIPETEISFGKGIIPSDWNGDGNTDLMWYNDTTGENNWYVFDTAMNYTTFSDLITPSHIDGAPGVKGNLSLGDATGNGLLDFFWYDENTGSNRFILNNGGMEFDNTTKISSISTSVLNNATQVQFVDWNNDGRAGMIIAKKDTGLVYIAENGKDFMYLVLKDTLLENGDWDGRNPLMAIADINGDGLVDIVTESQRTPSPSLRLLINTAESAPFIDQISDGSGLNYEIEYRPITNDSVYTKGDSSIFPLMDIEAPIWVVSEHRSPDGLGGKNSYKYKYEKAVSDLKGRGFRGFEVFAMKDESRNIYIRDEYVNDDFGPGRHLKRRKIYDATYYNPSYNLNNWNLISEKEYQKGRLSLYNGTVFHAYDSVLTENTYYNTGFGATLLKQDIYRKTLDTLGNVTQMIVTKDTNVADTINSYYSNYVDANHWVLGKLDSTEIIRYSAAKGSDKRYIIYEYDVDPQGNGSGMLTKEIIHPRSDSTLQVIRSYEHDSLGRITKSITRAWDGENVVDRVTESDYSIGVYQFNSQFNDLTSGIDMQDLTPWNHDVVKHTNALGHESYEVISRSFGSQRLTVDANGLAVKYEHDLFGRISKEIYPDGTIKLTQYLKCDGTQNCPANANFLVNEQASGKPSGTTYFDVLGREIRKAQIGFNGVDIVNDKEFNSAGEVLYSHNSVYDGQVPETWTHTYSVYGKTFTQDPYGKNWQHSYNPVNYWATSPTQGIRGFEKNSRGQMTSMTLNATVTNFWATYGKTHFDYNNAGNISSIADDLGNTITFDYDINGNIVSVDDPDMGVVTSRYNGFGEVIKAVNADMDSVIYRYDELGRIIFQSNDGIDYSWSYDSPGHLGMLMSNSSTYGDIVSYSYDDLNRIETVAATLQGENFHQIFTYDEFGRDSLQTYSNGFTIRSDYNPYGYLEAIFDHNSGDELWRLNEMSADLKMTDFSFGNGIHSLIDISPISGNVNSIESWRDDGQKIQSFHYSYLQKSTSNALSRIYDSITGNQEEFTYDVHGMILFQTNVTYTDSLGQTHTDSVYLDFDDLQNITFKSDVGTFHYGLNGDGPRTLSRIDFANGICTPSVLANYYYNDIDKIDSIWMDDEAIRFVYDAGGNRIKQTSYNVDGLLSAKYFFSGQTERIVTDSGVVDMNYIRAYGKVFAVQSSTSSGTSTIQYWHRDRMGSVQMVTDENQNITGIFNYDPWGKSRDPFTWSSTDRLFVSDDNRGFTGHEHLSIFGLINMNGRVYDPTIARFLTPDPNLVDNMSPLGFNRFIYCIHNPLMHTDPSGYFLDFLFGVNGIFTPILEPALNIVGNAIMDIVTNEHFATAVGIGAALIIGPAALSFASNTLGLGTVASAAFSGAAAGFGSAFVGTIAGGGSMDAALNNGLKAAPFGAINAVATFGVAEMFPASNSATATMHMKHATTLVNVVPKMIAHGVVQGAITDLQGGKFRHGFNSGAANTFGQMGIKNINSTFGKHVASALVGGTASELGGGKFENGAMSGSFISIYNDGFWDYIESKTGVPQRYLKAGAIGAAAGALIVVSAGTAAPALAAVAAGAGKGAFVGVVLMGVGDVYTGALFSGVNTAGQAIDHAITPEEVNNAYHNK